MHPEFERGLAVGILAASVITAVCIVALGLIIADPIREWGHSERDRRIASEERRIEVLQKTDGR